MASRSAPPMRGGQEVDETVPGTRRALSDIAVIQPVIVRLDLTSQYPCAWGRRGIHHDHRINPRSAVLNHLEMCGCGSVVVPQVARPDISSWAMKKNINLFRCLSGGANRNRTDDLLNAIQALSQLSYGPFPG